MRRYLIALVVVGSVAGGFAGSAAADDTPRRICLMTTDDPKDPGPEPICVRIGE